jgi:hypothetical protein
VAVSRRGLFKGAALAAVVPFVGKEAAPALPYHEITGVVPQSGYQYSLLIKAAQAGLISNHTALGRVLDFDDPEKELDRLFEDAVARNPIFISNAFARALEKHRSGEVV